MLGGRRDLVVTRHRVPLGLRVAHLTDLHLDRTGIPPRRIGAALRQIAPDLVVMTGDYFDRRFREDALAALMEELSPYPLVSVLGNHDHMIGPPSARRRLWEMLAAGGPLLRNATARAAGITVYGMDDPVTRHAAADCPPVDLVLAHSPDLPMPADRIRARLILAGHYHGGQVRVLPARLLARLVLRQDALAQAGHLSGFMPGGPPPLYVSRGLGESGMPLRLFAAPEIAVFEGAAPREDAG